MLWIGIAIVILTFWFLYKNYEARLVLVIAGVLMTILGQCAGSATTLEVAANAFIKQLVGGTLVTTIPIAREVGARYVALRGKVDAIIVTGGIAHSEYCM
ncbi:MAG: hypothetical protein IIV95_04755, partial [Burkholderiaceae bacterium]|nr:hypothetical protein [Burkholderiaceae bacterium]